MEYIQHAIWSKVCGHLFIIASLELKGSNLFQHNSAPVHELEDKVCQV